MQSVKAITEKSLALGNYIFVQLYNNDKKNIKLKSLIDTGADINCVSKQFVKSLGLQICALQENEKG